MIGGDLSLSYLDEGFILKKKIGQNQPKRIENAKIMVANTPMDADKVKVFGSKVKVDSIKKVAEIEEAEKQKVGCLGSAAIFPVNKISTATLMTSFFSYR